MQTPTIAQLHCGSPSICSRCSLNASTPTPSSNFQKCSTTTVMLQTSRRGTSSKLAASRPSPGNCKTGAINCSNQRGIVLPIIFNTVEALPLAFARFPRPHGSRGKCAEQPHDMNRTWPLARPSNKPEQFPFGTQMRTLHVHHRAAVTFGPRIRLGQGTVQCPGLPKTLTIHEPASAMDAYGPQTIRSLELSISTTTSRTRTVHEPRLARKSPRRCLPISFSPPTSFPVPVRIGPAYEHV